MKSTRALYQIPEWRFSACRTKHPVATARRLRNVSLEASEKELRRKRRRLPNALSFMDVRIRHQWSDVAQFCCPLNRSLGEQESTMLRHALICLVIALLASVLGIFGLSGGAMEAVGALFFVFLVLLVISLIGGRRGLSL
jgi:uncharacterized membrane protein YtjA (UPF0391 family)